MADPTGGTAAATKPSIPVPGADPDHPFKSIGRSNTGEDPLTDYAISANSGLVTNGSSATGPVLNGAPTPGRGAGGPVGLTAPQGKGALLGAAEDSSVSRPPNISEAVFAQPPVRFLVGDTDDDSRDTVDSCGRGSPMQPPGTPASTESASKSSSKKRSNARLLSRVSSADLSIAFSDTGDATTLPADKLVEYQWPPSEGDIYMLQEQVSEYLGVLSFRRKYPEVQRRPVEADEKEYLVSKGVVPAFQADLGLNALRVEEVLDLLNRDFPEKEKEYLCVVQQREKARQLERKMEYERQSATLKTNKEKMALYRKKAMEATNEFNRSLNEDRFRDRQAYFDMHTMITHYPLSTRKLLTPEETDPGPYPVALLPGQFQNYYKKYTSEELYRLPLNSVFYPEPPPPVPEDVEDLAEAGPDDLDSLANGSVVSKVHGDESNSMFVDESSQMSTMTTKSTGSASLQTPRRPTKGGPHLPPPDPRRPTVGPIQEGFVPKNPRGALCGLCTGDKQKNKGGLPEDLIHCAECDNSGHPSCLQLPAEMVSVVRRYPWQCMECKACVECRDPHDEDRMMFCDVCDRGFHTYCVGLQELPTGRWVCGTCGLCESCFARQPAGHPADDKPAEQPADGKPAEQPADDKPAEQPGDDKPAEDSKPGGLAPIWLHKYSQPKNPDEEPTYVTTLCVKCNKFWEKGNFCPICLKVYDEKSPMSPPIVNCNSCDRGIHAECDGVNEEMFFQYSEKERRYKCAICRGEVVERCDTFHRKRKIQLYVELSLAKPDDPAGGSQPAKRRRRQPRELKEPKERKKPGRKPGRPRKTDVVGGTPSSSGKSSAAEDNKPLAVIAREIGRKEGCPPKDGGVQMDVGVKVEAGVAVGMGSDGKMEVDLPKSDRMDADQGGQGMRMDPQIKMDGAGVVDAGSRMEVGGGGDVSSVAVGAMNVMANSNLAASGEAVQQEKVPAVGQSPAPIPAGGVNVAASVRLEAGSQNLPVHQSSAQGNVQHPNQAGSSC